MYVELDLTTVPPGITLHEPDDFERFEVVISGTLEDTLVDPQYLVQLAGSRADDPEWQGRLEAMIAFAESRGWVDPSGAVRAHIVRRR